MADGQTGFAQIQQAAQRPLEQVAAGTQRGSEGIKVALQAEQVKQQRDQLEIRKRQLQAQQLDSVNNSLLKVALAPKGLRQVLFKSAQAKSQALGIPMSPDLLAVINDEQIGQQLPALFNAFAGLSPDDKAGSAAQYFATLTSPEAALEAVSKMGTAQQRAGAAQQKQVLAIDNRVQQGVKDIRQGSGDQIDIINSGNRIEALLSDPKTSQQPFVGQAAQVVFAKLLDPQSVVRGSELKAVQGLTSGLLDKINLIAQGQIKGLRLTVSQRRNLLEATRIIARGADKNLRVAMQGQRSRLTQLGANEQQVSQSFAGFPSFREPDIGFDALSQTRSKLEPEARTRFDALVQVAKQRNPNLSDAEIIAGMQNARAQSRQRAEPTKQALIAARKETLRGALVGAGKRTVRKAVAQQKSEQVPRPRPTGGR